MVISHSFVSGLWGHFGFHLIHFDRGITSFFPLSTSSLTSRMEPITCHRINELVSPNLEFAFMLLLTTLPNRYCVTRILRNIPLIESFHTLAYRSEILLFLLLPLLLSSSHFSNTSIHLDHHRNVFCATLANLYTCAYLVISSHFPSFILCILNAFKPASPHSSPSRYHHFIKSLGTNKENLGEHS